MTAIPPEQPPEQEAEENLFAPPVAELGSGEAVIQPDEGLRYEEPHVLRRMASIGIDALILLGMFFAGLGALFTVFPDLEEGLVVRLAWGSSVVLFLILNASWLYRGRSIGKAVCGLWVVRDDGSQYHDITLLRMALRWIPFLLLPLLLPTFGLLVLALDAFLGFRDPPRSGHDELAGTSVLR